MTPAGPLLQQLGVDMDLQYRVLTQRQRWASPRPTHNPLGCKKKLLCAEIRTGFWAGALLSCHLLTSIPASGGVGCVIFIHNEWHPPPN